MPPSVLLIGAGGTLGTPLVQEFIRQKEKFGRIAILATEPSKKNKFVEVERRGIEVIIGSLLDADSYKGFEFVISLVGYPLLRLQPAMIELAVSAGVRHFYPSEYGSDLSQPVAYRARYFRSKQDTRNHLIATAKEHPEFQYTLLMTGGFMEFAPIGAGVDEEMRTATYYGRPEADYHLTAISDVCRYLVESIFLPCTEQRREIRVVGEKTTMQGFIDTLGRVKGVKYDVSYLDPSVAAMKQLESWKAMDEASEYLWGIREFLPNGTVVPGELDNDNFSFVPQTLEEALRKMYSL